MGEANQLMEALKKASAEPEARPAFYGLLMKADILVPGRSQAGGDGAPLQVGFKQWTQPDGSMAIPFFSDVEDLKRVLGPEEPYLTFPALGLFQMTRGSTLVLIGPGGLSKSFRPDEVDMLLSSAMARDPLAEALERAVREGSDEAKNNFYRVFINSQVFVFGEPRPKDGMPPPQTLATMGPEDKFTLATIAHPQKAEERIIPFFSSSELLHRAARGANLPPQTTFLGFAALAILNIARNLGLPLVMNLGPTTYKIFNLEEVNFILDNSRTKLYEDRQLPAGSQIQLAPPEVYPQELAGAFLDFLPGVREVTAAYLTTMKEETKEAGPGLLIGLETEGEANLSEMLNRFAPLVARHAPPGQAVDFTLVKPGEKGLSHLLRTKVSPFYRRSLSGEAEPGAPAAPEEAPAQPEEAGAPGIFGRLQRIFKG